ncbi:MAG: hypothetical protein WB777_14085 [Mycobacterium sp.]
MSDLKTVSDVRKPEKFLPELLEKNLWEISENGWKIHDYHDYQPTAEEAKAITEKRKEAGRRGGLMSGKARSKEANAEANASGVLEAKSNPDPTRPVLSSPSVSTTSPTVTRERGWMDDLQDQLEEFYGYRYPMQHVEVTCNLIRKSVPDGQKIGNPTAYVMAAVRANKANYHLAGQPSLRAWRESQKTG